jgi:hypothetical protein
VSERDLQALNGTIAPAQVTLEFLHESTQWKQEPFDTLDRVGEVIASSAGLRGTMRTSWVGVLAQKSLDIGCDVRTKATRQCCRGNF